MDDHDVILSSSECSSKHIGRLTRIVRQDLRYIGYSFCLAWSFCTSSIYELSSMPSLARYLLLVMPGAVSCVIYVLLFHVSHSPSLRPHGRGTSLARLIAARPVFQAILAACGTVLYLQTDIALLGVHASGAVMAGLGLVWVIGSWFEAYLQLKPREIVALLGVDTLLASIVSYAIALLPLDYSAMAISLLPLVALITLPAPSRMPDPEASTSEIVQTAHAQAVHVQPHASATRPNLAPSFKDAFKSSPWRTYAAELVIYLSFTSITASGPMASSWRQTALLTALIPSLAVCLILVGIALYWRRHLNLGYLSKIALLLLATSLLLLITGTFTSPMLAFSCSMFIPMVAWAILLHAGKNTPPCGWTVFACGWMAQCLGGLIAYALVPLAHISITIFVFINIVMLIIAGIFFLSEENMTIDLIRDDSLEKGPATTPTAASSTSSTSANQAVESIDQITVSQTVARASSTTDITTTNPQSTSPARVARDIGTRFGLSPREIEVLELWATGHGLRRIQDDLCISQSTAKTHVRHIYEKCGVATKAELMTLFETWPR